MPGLLPCGQMYSYSVASFHFPCPPSGTHITVSHKTAKPRTSHVGSSKGHAIPQLGEHPLPSESCGLIHLIPLEESQGWLPYLSGFLQMLRRVSLRKLRQVSHLKENCHYLSPWVMLQRRKHSLISQQSLDASGNASDGKDEVREHATGCCFRWSLNSKVDAQKIKIKINPSGMHMYGPKVTRVISWEQPLRVMHISSPCC